MILSVFGSTLAPATSIATSVPFPLTMQGIAATINGEAAPLWYVSPGQLNVQIPYEVPVGSTATIEIDNNGQITSQTLHRSCGCAGRLYGPEWCDQQWFGGRNRAAVTTLYLTGAGTVSPAIATGAAPQPNTAISALPAPTQTVSITVGGVQVATPFAFIGTGVGLVGVTQINFQVPTGIPTGNVPVVVTIGGVPSATVYLNVAN